MSRICCCRAPLDGKEKLLFALPLAQALAASSASCSRKACCLPCVGAPWACCLRLSASIGRMCLGLTPCRGWRKSAFVVTRCCLHCSSPLGRAFFLALLRRCALRALTCSPRLRILIAAPPAPAPCGDAATICVVCWSWPSWQSQWWY